MLMFNRLSVYFLAIFVLGSTQQAKAQMPKTETVIHYTPVEDPSDKRLDYPLAILGLALDKTEKKYGTYKFKSIPAAVSLARSVHELNLDTYSNYFFPSGEYVQEMSNNNLISVDFPLDHGLLSYRICFVSPAAQAKVSAATDVNDLRKFTMGQGTNWPDIPILEANGFRVQQVSNYMGLFKMVMGNRVDLFCRGIIELHREYREYKSMGNLLYDESFALVYSMPFTLYFNKKSRPLVKRIEEGLAIAKKDGSLDELFMLHYRDEILFAKLKQRKLFRLESPYGQNLSPAFKSYLIDPLKVE